MRLWHEYYQKRPRPLISQFPSLPRKTASKVPQIDGPTQRDLTIFEALSHTTIEILEQILNSGYLDHETLGWGVYGLSAGYITNASRREAKLVLSYKKRLHDALCKMPSMDAKVRKGSTVLHAVASRLRS